MKDKFIVGIGVGVLLLGFSSCKDEVDSNLSGENYKQEMRNFVIGISEYSKSRNEKFVIIPQNGIELVTSNGESDGSPDAPYLAAIDGHGQEDLFYGYNNDDEGTPTNENIYLREYLDLSKDAGNTILVTDYCSTPSKMDESYSTNLSNGYVSFAASHRELDNIPSYPNTVFNQNDNQITQLYEAKNFLYLINPDGFATKTAFINAVTTTNYDVIIMDLFFHDGSTFTANEVTLLKAKANGGTRLVISYMSIGEAEDYRYYWNSDWNTNKPSWLDAENPDWAGNYKVKYWDTDWQNLIYGNDESYLSKILNAGFDGVYLDIIDAFEFYE